MITNMTHPEYIFTEDWFSGNIPVWTEALAVFQGVDNVRALEIGSFQGRSSVWLLENILTGQGSKIDCVDTFEGSIEHTDGQKKNMLDIFLNNISRFGGDKVRVFRGQSQAVLRKLEREETYDIIYVDGDHHAAAVLEDAVLAFPLLNQGGVLIFDDYKWAMELPELMRPAKAIDVFMEVFADKVDLMYVGYQVIVKKRVV